MHAIPIRTIKLPLGEEIPVLGQGTWGMAENSRRRADEIAALRLGLDLGMTLIETSEMYADGAAEELVAEALAGRREEIFIVSNVLPSNATRHGTAIACERSLQRLKTDRIDLYLLHWRGQVPLEETLAAFIELVGAGKIRYWGVSNFNFSDLEELMAFPGGRDVAADQVLYNLTRRGIEYDLLPWCRKRRIPIMAYAPFEQGRLLGHHVLRHIADKYDAAPVQVALAWMFRHDDLSAIPRAGKRAHVIENRSSLALNLAEEDLATLDRAFPPPTGSQPLERF